MIRCFCIVLVMFAGLAGSPLRAHAEGGSRPCQRPDAGTVVAEPPDLYSQDGVLDVSLTYYTAVDDGGRTLFCLVTPDGNQSPTLHVHPGETLNLTVTNANPSAPPGSPTEVLQSEARECGDSVITITSLNLHFHGTNTQPKCHSDQVIETVINSGRTFRYSIKIPANEPPGLYWYHPHIHHLSEAALQGGASGAIVVEGIENIQPAVAGLPARLLMIRDQVLPSSVQPSDADPAWDVTLNYVPVPYPSYTPGIIEMEQGRRELWRVANASADTILDLQLNYDGVAQPLEVVALDGSQRARWTARDAARSSNKRISC
jgi:FtsP/CotA-like multicopper oxidase with cupredoxin domain